MRSQSETGNETGEGASAHTQRSNEPLMGVAVGFIASVHVAVPGPHRAPRGEPTSDRQRAL